MSTVVTNLDSLDPLEGCFKEQISIRALGPEGGLHTFSKFKTFLLSLAVFSFVGFLTLPLPKFVLMFALASGVGAALALPIEYALYVFFYYLLFDGFFKLITGYDPLAHVGQDIVLLVIFLRSLTHAATGRVNQFSSLPHIVVISIFSIWVLLQYFNPFGLGFLPSLAGSKVFFAPIGVYFIAFHHLEGRARQQIIYWMVGLATFEGIFATCEYLFFPEAMFQLGGSEGVSYGTISKGIFEGAFYRPMGTCTKPGGPAVWMFLMAPLATYLLIKPGAGFKVRLLAVCFFVFAIPTLIFSQVRIAIVLSLLGIIGVVIYPKGNWLRNLTVASLALIAIIALAFNYMSQTLADLNLSDDTIYQAMRTGSTFEEDGDEATGAKMTALQDRMSTLGKVDTFVYARRNPMHKMLALAQEMPFGIGLSRVGSAAAPWMNLISKDPYFGRKWVFTDNLYLALFTELGIFGVFFWALMIFVMIFSLFKKSIMSADQERGFLVWVCCVGPFIFLLGGFDTEGILYAPVASVFWLMLGIGMKEESYVKRT